MHRWRRSDGPGMRRLTALALAVALVGASCADEADDATSQEGGDASTGGGIVVEGVDRVPGQGSDTADAGDAATEVGVAALPDIDDLVLEREIDLSSLTTDDPCTNAHNLVVGPEAESISELTEEGEQVAVFVAALESFGAGAVAALETMAEADDDASLEEINEMALAVDAITLEPCGWPLFGALWAAARAGAQVYCEVDAGDGDEAAEPVDDAPCAEFTTYPDSLPCFEATVDDPASSNAVLTLWAPVDCETGASVEWDGTSAAWVESDGLTALDRFREVDQAIG